MVGGIFSRNAVALFVALTAGTADAVVYKATLLHPAGNYSDSAANGLSGGTQVGSATPAGAAQHAFLWSGTAATGADLNPTGFSYSELFGASGSNQVGYANSASFAGDHAFLWHGSKVGVVDLNPAGFVGSYAYAVSGNDQGGEAYYTSGLADLFHAVLWHGTAASAVDLNPAGYQQSSCEGVSGGFQFGSAALPSSNFHATLWNGTAVSALDLNPTGFSTSSGKAIASNGSVQVGDGIGAATGGRDHALLWSGTAASATDLNPAGFTTSRALGVSGIYQVGSGVNGTLGNFPRALVWSGTAASAVDLHTYLTGLGITFKYSEANGVDSNGTIVGYGSDGSHNYAVMWTPVPEPSTWVMICVGAVIVIRSPRRKLLRSRMARREPCRP
ncbi:MAG TPA: hypothetical protein VGM76_15935 [Lacipirellulaceae bacterium]|jgi:hypothetical protein